MSANSRKKIAIIHALVLYLTGLPYFVSGWFLDIEGNEPWVVGFSAFWAIGFLAWLIVVGWAVVGFSVSGPASKSYLKLAQRIIVGFLAMFVSMTIFITVLLGSTELIRIMIERFV